MRNNIDVGWTIVPNSLNPLTYRDLIHAYRTMVHWQPCSSKLGTQKLKVEN